MNTLILLASLGIITLLSEIFNFKKVLYPLTLIGLATTIFLNVEAWGSNSEHFNMLRFNDFALAFSTVLTGIALLWFIMAKDFVNNDDFNKTNYYALILFSLVGAVIMTSYTNMTMLFLGIEILSIPMYVLAGSNKKSLASNEAAFKYLIMGAFATGFLLFGITLIYGSTGSFDLQEIETTYKENISSISPIYYVGILLILIAMSFKVSAVPFHFWAPDVYQGAPTEVTAYMATIVKTAAFAAFIRLFYSAFSDASESWTTIVWVISAFTLLIGNITAVLQSNTKRMLAYSSIAHAGYMLMALLSGNEYSQGAILYYTLAYAIGSIATFSIVNIISMANEGNEEISIFNGLAKTSPLLAISMTIALLSLAGIPPMSGFFAKFSIFLSAFVAGNTGLVVIAIIASLIGVYYYFRIIIAMFFGTRETITTIEITQQQKLLLIIVSLATIALGLFPNVFIDLIE